MKPHIVGIWNADPCKMPQGAVPRWTEVRIMPEYIEREAAMDIFGDVPMWDGYYEPYPFELHCAIVGVVKLIKEELRKVPTADVAPVAHGRWEDSTDEWFGTDVYTCSKCPESYVLVEGTPKQNLWNYCPNCGAKMDGGEDQ